MTKVTRVLEYVLMALLISMTLVVIWGVFTRYFLGGQASWTEELARFMLIWIALLGAAYVSGQRKHLAIDLIGGYLAPLGRLRLDISISALITLFAISVMVVGGVRLLSITYILGQISPALQVPMFIIYSVIPISGLLVVFFEYQYARGLLIESRDDSKNTA